MEVQVVSLLFSGLFVSLFCFCGVRSDVEHKGDAKEFW